MTLNRRTVLGATAALVALPATAFAVPSTPSPIAAQAAERSLGALWNEVVSLSMQLGNHATPIVHPQSGLPGWMYDQGEANALGNTRYGKLIDILRATPRDAEDVAIIARAARHPDIENGPRTYGAARLAHAAMTLAA